MGDIPFECINRCLKGLHPPLQLGVRVGLAKERPGRDGGGDAEAERADVYRPNPRRSAQVKLPDLLPVFGLEILDAG